MKAQRSPLTPVSSEKNRRNDIVERKRAEETLRESEERFRKITTSARDAIIILDNAGKLSYWNEAAEKMFGYSGSEVLGQELHNLLAPSRYHDAYQKGFGPFRTTGQGPVIDKTLELWAVQKGGAEIPVELSVSALKLKGQWHALGIVRDITERKRTEDDLRKHRDHLEEIVEARTRELYESEKQFRLLAESLPQLVWTCLPDGPCDYLNEQWVKYTGIPEEKQLGYAWLEQLHPDDRKPTIETWQSSVGSGVFFDVEFRIRRHDGVYRWFKTRAVPLKNSSGQILKWYGSNTDIDDLKKAENKLLRNARELDARNRIIRVFLTVPDEEMYAGVLAIILEVMGSRYGVFGYLDESGHLVVPTMSRTIWDKCQVADKKFVFPRETWSDSSWPTAIRQKRTICLNESSTRTPEGHIGITRHISLPLIHQHEVLGLIQVANKDSDYTAEDMSLLETLGGAIAPVLDARLRRERQEEARQRAEEALASRTLDLERSNKELELFAYIASHDLQEPLRMVSSYTQLLAQRYKGKLDADAEDFIGYAVDGVNRMQRQINDLLVYSRVGTRGRPLELTDANEALGQARANLSLAIEEKRAIVTNDELPTVLADAGQLIQIFQNLIGNSLKFHGPEPPRIHVSAAQRGTEWIFSVKDNGLGIEPQYFERIFLLFQRLNHRDEYAGTGIGLAIANKIVERHGGRIWLESTPGQGSIFYFTIPVHRR